MADAYDLYLPSDFPEDLAALLAGQSLDVATKTRKLSYGVTGKDYSILGEGKSMSILEAPPTKECPMRYLLCLANPEARDLLGEVTSFLESLGARNRLE